MEKVVFDTNVLIDISRENVKVINGVKQFSSSRLSISIITAGEFLNGARNKHEQKLIQHDLQKYTVLPINKEISELFIELMNKYTLSHKPFVPDLLIAATCMHHNLPLYTINRKDFRFISGLKLL